MRREIKIAAVAVLAAMSFAVPGAGAATPQEICRDFVDNGRLDGTYTQAELEAFLRDPSVQGYCPTVAIVPPPPKKSSKPPKKSSTPPTAAVAGATSPTLGGQPSTATAGVAGQQTPLKETAQAETLPFTGAELGLFALVGSGLLAGGLALRASGRRR